MMGLWPDPITNSADSMLCIPLRFLALILLSNVYFIEFFKFSVWWWHTLLCLQCCYDLFLFFHFCSSRWLLQTKASNICYLGVVTIFVFYTSQWVTKSLGRIRMNRFAETRYALVWLKIQNFHLHIWHLCFGQDSWTWVSLLYYF